MENRAIASVCIGLSWAIVSALLCLSGSTGAAKVTACIAGVFGAVGIIGAVVIAVADVIAIRREPHQERQLPWDVQ